MMEIRVNNIQVLRMQSDIGFGASIPSRSAPTVR